MHTLTMKYVIHTSGLHQCHVSHVRIECVNTHTHTNRSFHPFDLGHVCCEWFVLHIWTGCVTCMYESEEIDHVSQSKSCHVWMSRRKERVISVTGVAVTCITNIFVSGQNRWSLFLAPVAILNLGHCYWWIRCQFRLEIQIQNKIQSIMSMWFTHCNKYKREQ